MSAVKLKCYVVPNNIIHTRGRRPTSKDTKFYEILECFFIYKLPALLENWS